MACRDFGCSVEVLWGLETESQYKLPAAYNIMSIDWMERLNYKNTEILKILWVPFQQQKTLFSFPLQE